MPAEALKYLGTFATYSDLTGTQFAKEELIKLIKQVPLGGVFSALSQITTISNQIEDKRIRRHFIEYIKIFDKDNDLNIEEKLKSRILYTPQGLLTVWKWLFAYGDRDKIYQDSGIDNSINIIIYLCIIVSDYLYEDTKRIHVKYELIRNSYFNTTEDIKSYIARACYIYMDLVQDKNLYNKKEYVDYYNDFLDYYGYSIEDYTAALFGIYASFINDSKKFDTNWAKNINEMFSKTAFIDTSNKILSELLLNFDDAKEWAISTINEPWNFLLFYQKPLYRINDSIFMPIMPRILYDQFFPVLFHRIRNCYTKSDTNFLRFIGRPYEEYVKKLILEAVNSSSLPYTLISEFKYGKGGGKRSSDVILRLGTNILVIEAKAHRMTAEALYGAATEPIDRDFNKLVIAPLKQAHDRIMEIIEGQEIQDTSTITNIYLMVVNMEDFPVLTPFESEMENTLSSYYKIPIKSSLHISIEEFEMLCYLVSRKNGKPIFRLLNNKSVLFRDISFKNYIFSSHLPRKRPKFLYERIQRYTDRIIEMLFPKINDNK